MLIIIHQYKLARGITAELTFGMTIKYGSMVAAFPLPERPFICNQDEIFFQPSFRFKSGRKTIDIEYRKMFPPGIKDENGNVLPYDLDTLMTISFNRGRRNSKDFVVRQDKELESGIEIWRLDKGEEFPCSIERIRK